MAGYGFGIAAIILGIMFMPLTGGFSITGAIMGIIGIIITHHGNKLKQRAALIRKRNQEILDRARFIQWYAEEEAKKKQQNENNR